MDFETLSVAFRNLRREGVRTYLTLIGVIIGIIVFRRRKIQEMIPKLQINFQGDPAQIDPNDIHSRKPSSSPLATEPKTLILETPYLSAISIISLLFAFNSSISLTIFLNYRSNNNLLGSSNNSLTLTKKVTASLPSIIL